jgi:tetratricopeptide (TPR) repeat protein
MENDNPYKDWNVNNFYIRAKSLRKMGKVHEAIKICKIGLASHPLSIDLRCQLGLSLYEEGDYRGAKRELEEVARAIERNQIALKVLKIINSKYKQMESTKSSLKELGKEEDNNGLSFSIPPVKKTRTLAELYRKQGYIKEALLIYKELLESNPDDLDLKCEVDELEAQIGDGRSIIATLESWQKAIKNRIEGRKEI